MIYTELKLLQTICVLWIYEHVSFFVGLVGQLCT